MFPDALKKEVAENRRRISSYKLGKASESSHTKSMAAMVEQIDEIRPMFGFKC